MPVFLNHITTTVPQTAYTQDEAGKTMLHKFEEGSRAARLTRRIYAHSGIETRHSVLPDFREGADAPLLFDFDTKKFLSPSTGERNDLYSKEARVMFSATAERLVGECPGIEKSDITHVITVSCTGFFAPGPDFYIVKDLGLNPSTKRFHIGFMGCYAAFPALKMAKAFCEAEPEAVVLVVCLELCSLHLEPSEEIDDILATSVFGDGASGAIVSSRNEAPGTSFRMDSLNSTIAPDSEGDMAWTIGDHGFDMILSTYVPRILEANVAEIVDGLLSENDAQRADIEHWAIHPGGRAILDKVEQGLELGAEDLTASRAVLRDYGNMSSATILFVLDHIRRSPASGRPEPILAMAFGPGLTVESALLTRV
ncbi:MAG TPA: type III polyketide synthase [Bacteroidetes bacterium]|nr:type III polyketide synthase [Bacteroidota bacterium]